jgi:hypothetical protein
MKITKAIVIETAARQGGLSLGKRAFSAKKELTPTATGAKNSKISTMLLSCARYCEGLVEWFLREILREIIGSHLNNNIRSSIEVASRRRSLIERIFDSKRLAVDRPSSQLSAARREGGCSRWPGRRLPWRVKRRAMGSRRWAREKASAIAMP